MQVLLVGHVFIRNDIGVISLIALGKLFVSELVGYDESKSQDQDDHDLIVISFKPRRPKQPTSAIREIMQTMTPVV
jgi:hypothetical protein